VALINSVANLGGLFGPSILGLSLSNGDRIRSWLRLDETFVGSGGRIGLVVMTATMLLGFVLALCVPRDARTGK
jgi:hypothetical protein